MRIKSIVIAILAIILLAGGAYVYVGRRTPPATQEPIFTGFLPFEEAGERPLTEEKGVATSEIPSTDSGALDTSMATGTPTTSASRLRKLSPTPQAGGILFTRNAELLARYVEQSTGHVFETDLFGNRKRITNTTIPRVKEAYWQEGGSRLVLRYLRGKGNEVVNLQVSIVPRKQEAGRDPQEPFFVLQASRLPDTIRAVSVSPDGKQLFYLSDFTDAIDGSGSSVGITTDFTGAKQREVFTSPHQEWQTQWTAPGTIILTTSPASEAPGTLVFLDTQTGIQSLILEDMPGLTALANKNLSHIVYSESTTNAFTTNILVVDSGERGRFPVLTLPEKCISSGEFTFICAVPKNIPRNNYPEAWYLGAASFDDDLWKIDIASGMAEKIPMGDAGGEVFDIAGFSYDKPTHTLLFTNKRDGTLWTIGL